MNLQRIERRVFLSDINARITEKNITQKELSQYLGIRKSRLSLWLNGSAGMSIDSFIKIKHAVENWNENNTCKLHEPTYNIEESAPSLGFLIKKHLKQQDITQKSLADRVGTSQSRISEYIRGAVIPSLGVASRICKELKIDPKIFVDSCSKL